MKTYKSIILAVTKDLRELERTLDSFGGDGFRLVGFQPMGTRTTVEGELPAFLFIFEGDGE